MALAPQCHLARRHNYSRAKTRACEVMLDPGTLTSYSQSAGQSFYFRVTGSTGGAVWGTDPIPAFVAGHSRRSRRGVQAGETGVVKVNVLPAHNAIPISRLNEQRRQPVVGQRRIVRGLPGRERAGRMRSPEPATQGLGPTPSGGPLMPPNV